MKQHKLLPPRADLVVALDFAKPLRHVDLTPADASRGLDVGPAVIGFEAVGPPDAGEDDGVLAQRRPPPRRMASMLFTVPVVVPVPIADASMPFNVIAISSTLVALFVGSMFNALARKPRFIN